MKKTILLCLALSLALPLAAQKTDNLMVSPLDLLVDSLARKAYRNNEFVGLVIGVIDGRDERTYAYGETSKGNKTLPDANTVFEIGSITKTFTGILLALQVERGKMKAGDPVNKYLPDSVKLPAGITMVSLSNHTSGLPRFEPVMQSPGFDAKQPYANYSDKKLFSFLRTFRPAVKAGEKYEYSNLAAGLLGTLLARQMGISYERAVERDICLPLRLRDTRITATTSMQTRLAQGHSAAGQPVESWKFRALEACGAIKSTMKDMLVYARANMSTAPSLLEKAIRLSQQETAYINGQRVGMGWHLADGLTARRIVWHNGQTGGFYAVMLMQPEARKAVILMSNTSRPIILAERLIKAL